MRQERDLTKGAIVKSLWLFALPLMLGNVLQQLYNLVDTWVVGRYLGKRALAAVGASYTLMTFLTSVVIGLCLGAGAFFAMAYGRREKETFRNGIFMSFTAIGGLSIVLTILLYGFVRPLTYLLQVPADESPIDMEKVSEFFKACYKTGKTREEVASNIRDYISHKSSMKATLYSVVNK